MEPSTKHFPKKRFLQLSMPYNDKENQETNDLILDLPNNFIYQPDTITHPTTSSNEVFASSNSQNEATQLLHTIMENQQRMQHTFMQCLKSMQEQITKIQTFCDSQSNVDKIMRENLVISKETFKTVKKLFGEGLSRLEEEMGSLLPISTTDEMQQLENKLQQPENEAAIKTYLISRKENLPLDVLFRSLATDEFLDAFNWDGRCRKQALKNIKLFAQIFSDVYCNLSKKDFEGQIRKSVELAHNRSKQRRLKQQTSL